MNNFIAFLAACFILAVVLAVGFGIVGLVKRYIWGRRYEEAKRELEELYRRTGHF